MAHGPDGYERLTCICAADRFAKITHLRWKDGSGVTEEPAGYFCLECHSVVNAAKLIERVKVKIKQRELKELQDEIGLPRNEEAANAPAGSTVSSGKAGR